MTLGKYTWELLFGLEIYNISQAYNQNEEVIQQVYNFS